HEAGGVMEEQDGGVALLTQLDELGGLGSSLGGDGAVVADDAAALPLDLDKATHGLVIKQGLEVQEFGAVGDPGNDFPNVIGAFGVVGNDAQQIFRRVQGLVPAPLGSDRQLFVPGQQTHDVTGQANTVGVILRQEL